MGLQALLRYLGCRGSDTSNVGTNVAYRFLKRPPDTSLNFVKMYGSMSTFGKIDKSLAAAETVRKAREHAWLLCIGLTIAIVVFGVRFAVFTSDASIEYYSSNHLRPVLYIVIPLLVLVRTVVVAIHLGGNLKDPQFLITQETTRFSEWYLFKRILGLATNAA